MREAVPQSETKFYAGDEARAELSSHSSPLEIASSTLRESIKVGGNVLFLIDRWDPFLIHFKSNPSQLCVVGEAIVGLPTGRVQILARTYWLFPSQGDEEDSSLEDQGELRIRQGLYHQHTI